MTETLAMGQRARAAAQTRAAARQVEDELMEAASHLHIGIEDLVVVALAVPIDVAELPQAVAASPGRPTWAA